MSKSNSPKKPSLVWDFVYLAVIGFNIWLLLQRPSSSTSGTAVRVGIIAFCAIAFVLNRVARRVPTPERAAADMMRQQKAIYGKQHEYVRVGPEAFKGLDLQYYDDTGAFLYSQGFTYLADLQDKTAVEEFRWAHSVIRTMLGNGGTVCAGFYHVRILGWFRVLQWVGVIARRMKSLDLETELSDGSFVVTSNSLGLDTTGAVPGIDRHLLAPLTPYGELLQAHRHRVGAALAGRPGVQAVVMRDLTDTIAMQHRIQAVKNAHKQNIGYLDAHELANITGRPLDAAGLAVAREIEAIKEAEGLGPAPAHRTAPPPLSRQA